MGNYQRKPRAQDCLSKQRTETQKHLELMLEAQAPLKDEILNLSVVTGVM